MILTWLKLLICRKLIKIKIKVLNTLKEKEKLFHHCKQQYASLNYWNPNMIQNMNLKKVKKRLRKSRKFVQGLNIYSRRKNMRIRLKIGDIWRKIIRWIQLDWVSWISMKTNRLKVCIQKRLSQKIFIKKWIII